MFWSELVRFMLDRLRLHRDRGPQVLPDAVAADALARLDDAQLPARAGWPTTTFYRLELARYAGQRRPGAGQPRPAHPGRHAALHRLHGDAVDGPAQRGGHAGELHRHPVGAVAACSTSSSAARPTRWPARWSGSRCVYCVVGTRHHALHRPAADRRSTSGSSASRPTSGITWCACASTARRSRWTAASRSSTRSSTRASARCCATTCS